MSISELIKSRRTIHQFSDRNVSDDLIRQALELALWAPNHKMTAPWLFIKIGLKAREAIVELAVELKAAKDKVELSDVSKKAIRQKYFECPVLIAVAKKVNVDERTSKEDYASIAAGLQNAALFLWESGVGSKWTTGVVTVHPRVYQTLNVDSSQVELLGFFWVGYPTQVPHTPPRPSIDIVLSYSE